MTNNYLRYSIIGLLFLVPFVGFVISPSLFFPYITGKNLVFRALIEAAFVLYAILALRAVEYRPRLTAVFVAFLSFVAIIFAADVFGIYPFKSFWSNFERMEGFITHLHLFAYFIMLSAVFTGEKIWTRYFQTSLAASVIMGLVSFDPDKMQAGRVFSNLGNSTYLGIYMLFHIFIAGFLLVRIIERKGDVAMKWMVGLTYAFVILFDFYVFYNTGTRGALLGLVAGALFTSVAFAIWEKNKGLKMLGISVLAGIMLAVGSLAAFKQSAFIQGNPLLTRFASLATFDRAEISNFASTQGKSRFGIWEIAYEGFKERPVLGWGQDNFNYVFNKYYDPKIYDQEQWFDRAHNVFFDWLIAGGTLGLISYLALFAAGIYAIWKSRVHQKDLYFLFSDKVLLTALFIAYFIHNLFVFDSITSYILFFGMLAFISIHDKKIVASPALLSRPIKDESYLSAGSILTVLVGAIALYGFTISPYMAGNSLLKAISYQSYAQTKGNTQAFQATLESFDKALSHESITGISETREQLIQGASGALGSSAATNEQRGEYFEKTRDEFQKQFETSPDDTRYYLFYGSFMTRLGQVASSSEIIEDGINHLLKAAELSPRKQSVLFEVGSAYLANKNYKDAVKYFKTAFEGEPSYTDARFFYAVSLIYAADTKAAEETLKPLEGTAYMFDVRFIRAYVETKQMTKASQVVQAKVEYAKQLAASGKKAEAIKQLQEVIIVAPNFKTKGEKLIADINATK